MLKSQNRKGESSIVFWKEVISKIELLLSMHYYDERIYQK